MVQIKMNWDDGGIKRALNQATKKAVDDDVGKIERAIRLGQMRVPPAIPVPWATALRPSNYRSYLPRSRN